TITGAQVHNTGDDGWLLRTGVRVKGEIVKGERVLQPYGRVNLYHAFSGTDVARFTGPAGSTDIRSNVGGASMELAAGAALALTENTHLYAEVGKLWDTGGSSRIKSGLNGGVGVRVAW